MGYARRKPNTGNPSVRIDEEGEVESPLLYSTPPDFFLLIQIFFKILQGRAMFLSRVVMLKPCSIHHRLTFG